MPTFARPAAMYVASAAAPPAVSLLRDAWREIRASRQLIGHLIAADKRKTGADTLLGNVWWMLDPLLQTPLYVLLFGVILRSGAPDYPLFLFAAILPWKWFTSSLAEATMSVSTRDRLIKQIPFPRIALPVAAVMAGTSQFVFGLVPLVAMLLILYRNRLSALLLLLPLVAIVQFVLTIALGVLLAALNVFARDTGRLSGYVLRLWFFLSPALYSVDRIQHVAERYPTLELVFRLNPFTTLFEAYRDVIYRKEAPDALALLWVLLASLVLLAITTIAFKRLEPGFAKVL